MYFDNWTGKPINKPSDSLPEFNGELCDECGSALIDRCLRCGAPVCCPVCCEREAQANRTPAPLAQRGGSE